MAMHFIQRSVWGVGLLAASACSGHEPDVGVASQEVRGGQHAPGCNKLKHGSFSLTTSLPAGAERTQATATMLVDGRVLVVGGVNNGELPVLATAFIFDPSSATWNSTPDLAVPRVQHVAVRLQSGRVLVTGGADGALSTELYDPGSNAWTTVGSLNLVRIESEAVLALDGRVLVTGGIQSAIPSPSSAIERFDPATGTWSIIGNLQVGRWRHTATLLPNGQVLVAGGASDSESALASAELCDPVSGACAPTGSLVGPRSGHRAVRLNDGRVLIMGGDPPGGVGGPLNTAEIYDPVSGSFSAAASMSAVRDYLPAVAMPDGNVLVVGGYGSDFVAGAEIYLASSDAWCLIGSLNIARFQHTATLLGDGRVLVAAGSIRFPPDGVQMTGTAEVLNMP